MKWPGFCGPSNKSQSAMASPERLMNWMCQRVRDVRGQVKLVLYPTPGLNAFVAAAESPGRGICSQSTATVERVFAAIGAALREVLSGGTTVNRGALAVDQYPATMVTNGDGGDELFITSGDTGYVLTLSTNVLTTEVSDVTMGGMMDGFFIGLDIASSTIKISDLLDGTTWDPTQFIQRSTAPDPWRALLGKYPRIWAIGEDTGDLLYNTGASPFPFAPVPNVQIPYGIAAPFTLKQVGSSVMWLTKNRDGVGQIVEAQGYAPTVVSNEAVELAIAAMTTISDAVAYPYQEQGHTFYVINFPTEGQSWAYDQTEGFWHERGSYSSVTGKYSIWAPQYHAYGFGKHLVLHASNGTVYEQSLSYSKDADDAVIRRLRIPPLLTAGQDLVFLDKLQLVLEPGLGLSSGQGSDPLVSMRMSRDAGKTWGNTRTRTAGAQGKYGTRVRWWKCGSGRNSVPEIVCSDPIPWRLIDLLVNADEGAA